MESGMPWGRKIGAQRKIRLTCLKYLILYNNPTKIQVAEQHTPNQSNPQTQEYAPQPSHGLHHYRRTFYTSLTLRRLAVGLKKVRIVCLVLYCSTFKISRRRDLEDLR